MKYILHSLIGIICGLFITHAGAVKIYECVDAEGNRTFQDKCPNGTVPAQEKKYYTGVKEANKPDVDITFYTVPDCVTCDVVRSLLDKYGASYTEKDIKSNIELQQEMMERTGSEGSLSVPTLIIGEKSYVGYDKSGISNSLEAAGYTLGGSGSGASTSEESAEELEDETEESDEFATEEESVDETETAEDSETPDEEEETTG